MLRLRLAGIPVEIHASHAIFMPLLAMFFAPRFGWAEHAPAGLRVAIGAVLASSALLLHELSMALAARAFGYRPSIRLVGLSAHTVPNPNETVPWYRDLAMNLAGPATGITLGFLFASLYVPLRGRNSLAEYTFFLAACTHLIWAVVQLIPLQPLKGGRIATAIAMRIFGRDGFLYAQLLGLVLAVVLAALALAYRQPLGLFALLYLVQTALLIAAFRRGALPIVDIHPHEQAAAHIEALYRDEKFEEALRVGRPLLEADLQPPLKARVHVLLGWACLKLGQGRAALDHFSQSPGANVPPHAIAAAFSLIGDDARAEPLWEQAARASGDPTLLHEWAGALIRLGREADAFRQPGLVRAAAFEAALRVPLARDDFELAARVAESRFATVPSAAHAYEAAALWARAKRPDDALRMLSAAAQHGFANLEQALHDDALSSLRDHAGFGAFLEGLRAGPRN